MKNQYFGDINDYRKYGLLRCIQWEAELRLLVAWMLTPDDGSSDGRFRSYLSEPARWERFDPELFRELQQRLAQSSGRHVGLIENSNLIPRASYFSQVTPDDRRVRASWRDRLMAAARTADIVFLDPDNGLEVASISYGTAGSSKYVYWQEVIDLWRTGVSLLIYQHFPRRPREPFMYELVEGLGRCTSAFLVETFHTSNVLFLLAGQRRHEQALRRAVERVRLSWPGQIQVGGLGFMSTDA